MAHETAGVLVDKDLRPAYYDDFHCLAAGCKLSCCKGWSITFDKKDYLSLKRQQGSPQLNENLGGALRRIRHGQNPSGHYGEFVMDSGACPLLGEDSLCTLQVEKGHEALPYVCRSYSRAEQYMLSGYLERSLSPSCEGVLKLLWELPEGVDFRSDPLPKTAHKRAHPTKEIPLPLWFPVVREWCVDRLQDRRFPLPQRILLMGLGLKELADGETDIERWMERAALLPESVGTDLSLPDGPKERAMVLTGCLRTLLSLQSMDGEMTRARQDILKALAPKIQLEEQKMNVPLEAYAPLRGRYEELYADREYFMENLLVTVFFHLRMPVMEDAETLWKSYVNFCNLYAFYRFMAVMSCREGGGTQAELFRLIALASRALLHNTTRQSQLRDEFFQNDSATLAHMAILLGA